MKSIFLMCLAAIASFAFGQKTFQIEGSFTDSSESIGLPNAIVMAVRVNDSVLEKFTRSDASGYFKMSLPRDTFEITMSHPSYDEKTVFIMANEQTRDIDFGKLKLPKKGLVLKELAVYSNNKPVFFRGDTLVMKADSFATGANANVEDLFKKLPGFEVDNSGTIKVQGTQVNRVLVDGDEFFGSDPTVATKNLGANSIDEVEVYEETTETADGEQKEKVINLKLKEDSKQGAFGKISGASDFTQFYEGEVLLNSFKGSRKVSVYGLASNTPRTNFDWDDAREYDISNNRGELDENGDWIQNPSQLVGSGLPSKAKAGFSFSDKFGKKNQVKLWANYGFDRHQLLQESNAYSQFLQTDTTYSSEIDESKNQEQLFHELSAGLTWKIDSLTTLSYFPKYRQADHSTTEFDSTVFITEENSLSRSTTNDYTKDRFYTELQNRVVLERDFKKKDRNLKLNFTSKLKSDGSRETLNSLDNDVLTSTLFSEVDQIKNGTASSMLNNGNITFIEPFGKRFKLYTNLIVNSSIGANKKITYDKGSDGSYNVFNESLSNDFETELFSYKVGSKLSYKFKKVTLTPGLYYNNVTIQSVNKIGNDVVDYNSPNILPYFQIETNFSNSSRLNITYNETVRNPSIFNLQTIPDNRNLNFIRVGNINLRPELKRSVNFNYHSYKALKGSYVYANLDFGKSVNPFSDSLSFDDSGRLISQVINTSDANTGNGYMGGGFPIFKHKVKINYNGYFNYNDQANWVNGLANRTNRVNLGGNGGFDVYLKTDTLEVGFNAGYNHSVITNEISSLDQTFGSVSLSGSFELKLPWQLELEGEFSYNQDLNRADGFNFQRNLIDLSISKSFGEQENWVLSVEGNDLLNQNLSNSRSVTTNIITDRRTNIIGRYVLFRAVYKFRKLKSNDTDEGNLLDQ